jgi:hypothetical protein
MVTSNTMTMTRSTADEHDFNHEYNPSSDPLDYETMLTTSMPVNNSIGKR